MSRTKPAPPREIGPAGPQLPAALTVVVLRFRDGTVVDVVAGLNDQVAIATVAERALRNGWELPLVEAVTSQLPYERLLALCGEPPAPPVPKPRPVIPIAGLVPAIAGYVKAIVGRPDRVNTARGALTDFFARYDCPVDFTGEPEPKEEVTDEPAARKSGSRA
jgi:hypothetical protein